MTGAAGSFRKVVSPGQAGCHVIVAVKAVFPGLTPRTHGKEDHACNDDEGASKKHKSFRELQNPFFQGWSRV